MILSRQGVKVIDVTTPIAFGGSDDMESLHDALASIKRQVPSAKFTKTEYVSGGWPVYRISVDSTEIWDLCEVLGIDQGDVL
jgi:hypothetical protein